jgi:hypothetical protein
MAFKTGLIRSLLLVALLLTFTGCGAPKSPSGKKLGALTIRSLEKDGLTLTGKFKTGYFAFHDANRVTVVLLDGNEDAPDQALIIRMLWLPRGSKTPVNRNATNATIKHIVFAGENRSIVGVYGGGGYFYPKQNPKATRKHLDAAIWDGSMALQHASKGFADRLGRVQIDGKLKNIIHDDAKVEALLDALDSEVSQKVGYKVLVQRDAQLLDASM